MRNYKFIIGSVFLLSSVSFGLMGCADMQGRDIGAVTGVAAGAALGSQIGGTGLVNTLGAAGGAVVAHATQ